MNTQAEHIIVLLVVSFLLYTRPNVLVNFSNTIIGRVILIAIMIMATLRSTFHGILIALVIIIFAEQIYEGFSDEYNTKAYMYGPWIGATKVLITAPPQKVGDQQIFMIYQKPYTKMVAHPSGDSKYYEGEMSEFSADKWSKATPITGVDEYKIEFDRTPSKDNNLNTNVYMYGPWVGAKKVLISAPTQKVGDQTIYMIYQSPYTKMVAYPSGDAKYYDGEMSEFSADKWSKATPITGANAYKLEFDITAIKSADAVSADATSDSVSAPEHAVVPEHAATSTATTSTATTSTAKDSPMTSDLIISSEPTPIESSTQTKSSSSVGSPITTCVTTFPSAMSGISNFCSNCPTTKSGKHHIYDHPSSYGDMIENCKTSC